MNIAETMSEDAPAPPPESDSNVENSNQSADDVNVHDGTPSLSAAAESIDTTNVSKATTPAAPDLRQTIGSGSHALSDLINDHLIRPPSPKQTSYSFP